MIIRRNYRACLDKAGLEEDMEAAIKSAIARDKERVSEAVTEHRCLTVAMYQHENMLFLYMEALEKDLEPAALFPELSKLLLPWPQKDGPEYWTRMYEIFIMIFQQMRHIGQGKGIRREEAELLIY